MKLKNLHLHLLLLFLKLLNEALHNNAIITILRKVTSCEPNVSKLLCKIGLKRIVKTQ